MSFDLFLKFYYLCLCVRPGGGAGGPAGASCCGTELWRGAESVSGGAEGVTECQGAGEEKKKAYPKLSGMKPQCQPEKKEKGKKKMTLKNVVLKEETIVYSPSASSLNHFYADQNTPIKALFYQWFSEDPHLSLWLLSSLSL